MSRKHISTVTQIGGILTVSLFLGLTYNMFSPKGIPLVRTAPVATAVPDSALFGVAANPTPEDTVPAVSDTPKEATTPITAPDTSSRAVHQPPVRTGKGEGLQVITIAQFEKILNRHQAVILDARNPDEFERGHIAGARNIAFTQIEKHFDELLEIPKDTMIVVYCSDPECPLGRELIKFMEQMDFGTLLLFDAGWDGWVAAGKGGEPQ